MDASEVVWEGVVGRQDLLAVYAEVPAGAARGSHKGQGQFSGLAEGVAHEERASCGALQQSLCFLLGDHAVEQAVQEELPERGVVPVDVHCLAKPAPEPVELGLGDVDCVVEERAVDKLHVLRAHGPCKQGFRAARAGRARDAHHVVGRHLLPGGSEEAEPEPVGQGGPGSSDRACRGGGRGGRGGSRASPIALAMLALEHGAKELPSEELALCSLPLAFVGGDDERVAGLADQGDLMLRAVGQGDHSGDTHAQQARLAAGARGEAHVKRCGAHRAQRLGLVLDGDAGALMGGDHGVGKQVHQGPLHALLPGLGLLGLAESGHIAWSAGGTS